MSALVILAVVVLVLGAAAALFTVQRNRDTQRAVGHLARETRERDVKARKATAPAAEAAPTTGKEVELATAAARQESTDVESAVPSTPVAWTPPDEDAMGVTRRQFMNRGIIAGFGLGIGGFAPAALAFLWPQGSTGFGSKISVGKVAEIKAQIDQNNGFLYYPEGRMWITEYPSASLDNARKVYSPSELAGMEAGLIALYQKCPHLGCRVPECATSQWFECGCHGSQYNRVGEKKAGPAPRGLDRFAMTVSGDSFTVDTGLIIQGPPIGVNTTGQEAEGPHCISGGAAH
ncbi:Rieske 2Fe-2S domain-containing protein [Iamia sp. SCSIO 61187]|uniref:QcrA and Rieske domain-containing protein n=1 Tax=Iamia sp. SCSIO 61187 TaxID=2722752 RepID=UPI001C62BD7A|nr:Rieske 2Fe-2S domain-containing protein [Iamia sp. SCSIO 61187]QYG94819.1 Rieske 2Fe-2S domain-containing protein [Iamia sp. SCSIO 61187]